MHRRTVLTGIGASLVPLSGCSAPATPDGEPTGTEPSPTTLPDQDGTGNTDTTDTESMESGMPRTVRLDGWSDSELRETFGIAATVTVLESRITTDHTARVRVTLANTTAQSRTLTYTRDRCDLNMLVGQSQRDADTSLLLVSTDQEWERTAADCWVPDGRNLECGIPAMDHQITIGPDEPLVWTFRLWADPETYETGRCMPVGAYQFPRTLRQGAVAASLSLTLSVESG